MKNFLPLLFAGILLVSCQDSKTGKAKDADGKKELVAGKSTYGYAVKAPAGWEKSDTTYMGQKVTFIRLPRENAEDPFMENVNIVQEKVGSYGMQEYLDASISNMEKGLTNFSNEPAEDVKMGDYEFKKIRYGHTYSGVDIDAELYIIIKDGVAYLLTCSASRGQREKYETSFEEIVRSFRID
jgi:hypothetical protein